MAIVDILWCDQCKQYEKGESHWPLFSVIDLSDPTITITLNWFAEEGPSWVTRHASKLWLIVALLTAYGAGLFTAGLLWMN